MGHWVETAVEHVERDKRQARPWYTEDINKLCLLVKELEHRICAH